MLQKLKQSQKAILCANWSVISLGGRIIYIIHTNTYFISILFQEINNSSMVYRKKTTRTMFPLYKNKNGNGIPIRLEHWLLHAIR